MYKQEGVQLFMQAQLAFCISIKKFLQKQLQEDYEEDFNGKEDNLTAKTVRKLIQPFYGLHFLQHTWSLKKVSSQDNFLNAEIL